MIEPRKEIIGDCTLYLGDCLEILPTLGKVDAVVTSPPYNQIDPSKMKPSGMFKSDSWFNSIGDFGYEDNMDESKYQDWMARVVGNCIDICCGIVWVNHKTRYRDGAAIHPLSFLSFPLYSEIVWDRGISVTLNARKYAPSHEYFFGFGKPKYWDNSGNTRMTVWRIAPQPFKSHVCSYPLRLVEPLVNDSTMPMDIVLDPFMGSGTTGVACVNLQRKFIGIEIEPKYFDIACKRIETANKQLHLFPANPPA